MSPALSRNFILAELVASDTADRQGIDNSPPGWVVDNLRFLTRAILQPVRDHYGQPVRVSSGYRCPELNAAIGGAPTSQHTRGEAADFTVRGVATAEVAEYIRDELQFDQLILEYPSATDPHAGWVHCSAVRGPRGQVLTAIRGRGYVPGIVT